MSSGYHSQAVWPRISFRALRGSTKILPRQARAEPGMTIVPLCSDGFHGAGSGAQVPACYSKTPRRGAHDNGRSGKAKVTTVTPWDRAARAQDVKTSRPWPLARRRDVRLLLERNYQRP